MGTVLNEKWEQNIHEDEGHLTLQESPGEMQHQEDQPQGQNPVIRRHQGEKLNAADPLRTFQTFHNGFSWNI